MSGIRHTESTLNLQDRKIPFWDSSDPYRNPAPMPLYPESPNLNHTPNGSPSKFAAAASAFGGSPIRQHPFGSRNSIHDDKLSELLDLTKQIQKENEAVKDSVQDALIEFGSLAYRSRDNGAALAQLQDRAKKSEESSSIVKSTLEDGLFKLTTSMENQNESQRALSLITDSLLETSRDIIDSLRRNESYLKDLSACGSSHDLVKFNEGNSNLYSTITSQHTELIKLVNILQKELSKTSKDTTKLLFQTEEHSKNLVSAATQAVATAAESAKSSKYDANQLEKINRQTLEIQSVLQSVQNDVLRLNNTLPEIISGVVSQGNVNDKFEQVEVTVKNQYIDLIETIKQLLNNSYEKDHDLSNVEILQDIKESHNLFLKKMDSKYDEYNHLLEKIGGNNLNSLSKATNKMLTEQESFLERFKQSYDEKILANVLETYESLDHKMIENQKLMEQIAKSNDKSIIEGSKSLVGETLDKLSDGQKSFLASLISQQESLTTKLDTCQHDLAEKIRSDQELVMNKQESMLHKINDNDEKILQGFEDLKHSVSENIDYQKNECTKQIELIFKRLLDDHRSNSISIPDIENIISSSSKSNYKMIEEKLDSLPFKNIQSQDTAGLKDQLVSILSDNQITQARAIVDHLNQFGASQQNMTDKNHQQLKSMLDETKTKHEHVIIEHLSSSKKSIEEIVLRIVDKLESSNSEVKVTKQLEQIGINMQSLDSSLTEKFGQIGKEVQSFKSDSDTELNKKIGRIGADVQSLIDFQYGEDMSTLRNSIASIVSNQNSNNQQQKIDEYQAKLQQAQEEISQLKASFTIFKYHDKEISEQESLQIELKHEVEDLRTEKIELSKQIERLKIEMETKFNYFNQLEERVQSFEQRLSSTILERSKGILGSTTLAMINNAPSPLKQSSSKRNLSLIPDNEDKERDGSVSPPLGKENELNISKRGSPFIKGRSVSLFIDH